MSIPYRIPYELIYQLHRLIYQLGQVGDKQRLARTLSSIPIVKSLTDAGKRGEIVTHWATIDSTIDLEDSYRQALDEWHALQGGPDMQALELIATLMGKMGRWPFAVELERKRLMLTIEANDRTAEASARSAISNLMKNLGAWEEALEEGRRALAIYEQLEDQIGLAWTRRRLGEIYSSLGDQQRALELFEEAATVFAERGGGWALEVLQGQIGIAYFRAGNFDEALKRVERKLRYCSIQGDRRGMADAIINIGVFHLLDDDLDTAFDHLTKAHALADELRDRSIAITINSNLGILYDKRGEYDEAVRYNEKAVEIAQGIGDTAGTAFALSSIGVVEGNRGNIGMALERFFEARTLYRSLGNRHKSAHVSANIGFVYSIDRRYDEAFACLLDTIDECRALAASLTLAFASQTLAETILNLVDDCTEMPDHLPRHFPDVAVDSWRDAIVRHARRSIDEAIELATASGAYNKLENLDSTLARLEAAEGRRDDAIARLYRSLSSADDDAARAEAGYWLWRIADRGSSRSVGISASLQGAGSRDELIAIYHRLLVTTPKAEYRRRIEELSSVEAST